MEVINEINSSNPNFNKYDIIIDITSIRFLDKIGWKIIYTGEKEKQKKIKDLIYSNEKKTIISILGHSNRGKSYILQKISGEKLNAGFQIQTRGISIKIPEHMNLMLLDTAGTNAPLLISGNDDPRNKPNFQKELDYINLCEIITNYIIQTFIIKEAQILICVVGMLTCSEQQFLNKVKRNCKNLKQLIVIHNLITCSTKEDIEKYIEKTLKKSIIHNFEEIKIPTFKKDKEDKYFNKYFIELDSENDKNSVLHFILVNDSEENKDSRFYNNSTIEFIRNYIDTRSVTDINIIKKFRNHIKISSSLVLINELKSIAESDDRDKIQCKEPIEPKEINADELDNITFVGEEYEPTYRYYKNNNREFIVEMMTQEINQISKKN